MEYIKRSFACLLRTVVMAGMFGPRHFDVLGELYACLHAYATSGKNIVEFLFENQRAVPTTPLYALNIINANYFGGMLHLPPCIPSPCVGTPEKYYLHYKSAEKCIAAALHSVYGVKKRNLKKNNAGDSDPLAILPSSKETDEEKRVKNELRWVLRAPLIKNELIQMKDSLKCIASNNSSFPWLNEYVNFNEFDRRIRPVIFALEREALPPECVTARVDAFFMMLYRQTGNALKTKIAKKHLEKV